MLSSYKPFILNTEDLPETCLLIPGHFEAIVATAHCEKAIRLTVREEQFLANIGFYKQKSFLILNFGLGTDTLLLLCEELFHKNVKNYFLLSPAASLAKKRPDDDVIFTDTSILASGHSKVILKEKLLAGIKKTETSLTMNLGDQVLGEKPETASKEKAVKILSAYDYYFFSFLNKNKLRGSSIHYFPDETMEPDDLVNYKQALLEWFELIIKPL